MAGTRQQVLAGGFAGLSESKVIANYDDQNRIVSYTVADLNGNPQLIMEPLEFEVYRSLPPNGRAQYLTSAQYELDSASYLLYHSAGETARAFEHLRSAYADPELWRNTAADVAIGSALGKVAGVIAKSEYGKKIAWAIERAITKADLPPGYVLAQDGRVLKDGRYVSEKEAAKAVNWKLQNGRDWYPANDGFVGTPKPITLEKGAVIDRYGDNDTAKFFSPPGTSLSARSLPAGSEVKPLIRYEVLKPLPVDAGKIAAWFGQTGGGTQYKSEKSVAALINEGYLRRLP